MMFTCPRTMNSYPYQTNHMPSTHYYHPNWEPAPMQARENPTGPLMHEPWPWYSGCQVPMACPNCSSHGHGPNPYYISPHCQQFPSPPPHFYGGYYPPYPQPCHVGYVPPPHYSMELPKYEYDKKVPSGFHCCECPNHQHNLKEEKGVKIEEHESDVEPKKSGSLIPSGANNFLYPVLWIPSEYGANKENFRSADKEVDDRHGKQVLPYVTRPQCVQEKKRQEFPTVVQHQQDSQPVEQDSARCGWFPMDMDSLRKLVESGVGVKARGEEKRNVDDRNRKDVEIKNQHKQFPYNIIWLPYNEQGEKKERIASTEPVQNASPISGDVSSNSDRPDFETEKMKTIPVQKLQECVPKLSIEAKEQKEAKQSGGNFRTIPVKQLEEFVPKPTVESKELKGVKEAKGKANEERAQKGVQLSSPTKKSKLPPICLRVDPPKKKNGSGNGTSRSPSPPGDKKRQSPDDLKTSGKSEAMQPSTKDIKVDAKDEKPSYNKIEVVHVPQNEKKESVPDKSANSKEKAVHKLNNENSDVTAGDGSEARKPTKKILSETESAIIIQSAYRGHEVRRTEPLKKLRQIVTIRDEVQEVRKRIEDLVSGVGNSRDKERVAIGEIIMTLLLKLDTIQGLLPSIRDFRKCVANELIVLQEKLDSITCQNAAHQETRTVEEQAKHSCMDEGHKNDLEIRNKSSVVDSSQVEVSEVNAESANEFLNDSNQGEGSEYNAGISDESSKDLVQHESSRIAEHVSILNEGSHGVDMNVSETEGKLANSMNQVPPCPPPTTENLVCDSENKENLEAVPVSISPVIARPAVSEESGESQIGIEYVADDPTPNGVTLGNEEAAENLLAELPRDVLDYGETYEETPETETDMESMLRELPIQVIDNDDANGETPEMTNIVTQDEEKSEKDAPEAALGVSSEDKDVDVDLLAELPHELPELVAEVQPGEVTSSAVLKHGSKVEQLSENPEPKPELRATESLAQVDHKPQSVDSNIDTEALIVEQDADEGVLLRDEGLAMCKIVKQESFCKHSESELQQTKDEDETSELSSESQDLDAETRNEEIEKKMIEENERMKKMLDKMIAYGKQQQDLISSLSSKVEDLEKRLAKKKATKDTKSKRPRVKVLRSKCGKSGNGLSKERVMGVAS